MRCRREEFPDRKIAGADDWPSHLPRVAVVPRIANSIMGRRGGPVSIELSGNRDAGAGIEKDRERGCSLLCSRYSSPVAKITRVRSFRTPTRRYVRAPLMLASYCQKLVAFKIQTIAATSARAIRLPAIQTSRVARRRRGSLPTVTISPEEGSLNTIGRIRLFIPAVLAPQLYSTESAPGFQTKPAGSS